MAEAVRLISARRLEALEVSLRRLRWGLGMAMVSLAVALAMGAAGRPVALRLTTAVRLAEASSADIVDGERTLLAAVDDPLYDGFLQEYPPLRDDPARRRFLTAQVLAAAAVNHLDPDLLFALIAAESRFDSEAISPKGARGLGQMKFSTARAVAPGAVREPEDLHDIPRNLHATALHLRGLLEGSRGDLRGALRAYYAGGWDRNGRAPDRDKYVARVSTYYAFLKGKRTHRHLAAAAGRSAPPPPQDPWTDGAIR